MSSALGAQGRTRVAAISEDVLFRSGYGRVPSPAGDDMLCVPRYFQFILEIYGAVGRQ